MTSTGTAPSREQMVVKHPIRGAIWGLLLGLSVAIYLVLFRIVPFGDWLVLGLVVLGGVAVGVLWAMFAPARQPKDVPPPPGDDIDRDIGDDLDGGLDDDLVTDPAPDAGFDDDPTDRIDAPDTD